MHAVILKKGVSVMQKEGRRDRQGQERSEEGELSFVVDSEESLAFKEQQQLVALKSQNSD